MAVTERLVLTSPLVPTPARVATAPSTSTAALKVTGKGRRAG